MKRRPSSLPALVLPLALVAPLALAGCVPGLPARDRDRDDSRLPAASDELLGSTPTPTAEPVPEQEQFAVQQQVIADEPLGHSVTITDVVRNFAVPDGVLPSFGGSAPEVVLVRVDATAGSAYYTSLSASDLTLRTSPGGVPNSPDTYLVSDAMGAAGHEPLTLVSRGQHGAGWLAFELEHPADDLWLSYDRAAQNDGAIPAVSVEVPLTRA
jgi:hypothetical protein